MRAFAAITAALALLATPADAQMGKRDHGDRQKTEQRGPRIDEKAYKAALERIPDSKEKYDPWGSLGVAKPAKKTN